MSNEFYNFIAKNILHFFQTRADEMQPGERYCLKLDTQEMVAGVDDELRKLTTSNNIQGVFNYGSVYSTYTIYLKPNLEVVVASKINGMTDDFLATIRNAEMTEDHFPVLMITSSAIDTLPAVPAICLLLVCHLIPRQLSRKLKSISLMLSCRFRTKFYWKWSWHVNKLIVLATNRHFMNTQNC